MIESASDFLSPQELRYAELLPSTKADKGEKDQLLSKSLHNVAGVKRKLRKPDGSFIEISEIDLLNIKWFKFLEDNPSKYDPAQLSKALGEQKNSTLDVNVVIKPSEMFSAVDRHQEAIDVEATEEKPKKVVSA